MKLKDIVDYDTEFETYKMPSSILEGACTRSETVNGDDLVKIWREFRMPIKPLIKIEWMDREKKFQGGEMINWNSMILEMNKIY